MKEHNLKKSTFRMDVFALIAGILSFFAIEAVAHYGVTFGWLGKGGASMLSLIIIILGGAFAQHRKFHKSMTAEVERLKEVSLSSSFFSVRKLLASIKDENEKALRLFGSPFYLYHLSYEGGESYWRCTALRFAESSTNARLEAEVKVSRPSDCMQGRRDRGNRYIFFPAVKSNKVMIYALSASESEVSVFIFPEVVSFDPVHHTHAGVHDHVDWDGKSRLSPVVIAKNPLHKAGDVENGIIKEDSATDVLFRTWKELVKYRGIQLAEEERP